MGKSERTGALKKPNTPKENTGQKQALMYKENVMDAAEPLSKYTADDDQTSKLLLTLIYQRVEKRVYFADESADEQAIHENKQPRAFRKTALAQVYNIDNEKSETSSVFSCCFKS